EPCIYVTKKYGWAIAPLLVKACARGRKNVRIQGLNGFENLGSGFYAPLHKEAPRPTKESWQGAFEAAQAIAYPPKTWVPKSYDGELLDAAAECLAQLCRTLHQGDQGETVDLEDVRAQTALQLFTNSHHEARVLSGRAIAELVSPKQARPILLRQLSEASTSA